MFAALQLEKSLLCCIEVQSGCCLKLHLTTKDLILIEDVRPVCDGDKAKVVVFLVDA